MGHTYHMDEETVINDHCASIPGSQSSLSRHFALEVKAIN